MRYFELSVYLSPGVSPLDDLKDVQSQRFVYAPRVRWFGRRPISTFIESINKMAFLYIATVPACCP